MVKKILVVDNNPVIVKLIANMLEKQGHQVVTAADGLAALQVLEGFVPDIVFVDLIMPNISGDLLCRIIRNNPALKDVFIVILSGVAAEEGFTSPPYGADVCIAKGPTNSLLENVNASISQSHQSIPGPAAGKILGLENIYGREIIKELLSKKRHFEVILENINEVILELTHDGTIIYANPAAVTLIGTPEEQLLSKNFSFVFKGSERDIIEQTLSSLTGPRHIGEDALLTLNGRQVSLCFVPLDSNGNQSVVVIARDITEQKLAEEQLKKAHSDLENRVAERTRELQRSLRERQKEVKERRQAEEALRESEERYRALFENNPIETIIVDKKARVAGYNLAKVRSGERLPNLGDLMYKDYAGKHKIDMLRELQDCIKSGVQKEFPELHYGEKYLHIRISPYSGGAIITSVDITERKRLEAKLHEASISDELTALFNRRGFMTMAEKQLRIANRTNSEMFLLYADLDNLKWINDHLGHKTGDQALIEAAAVLRDTFRQSDVIGRLGGDEFAVLLTSTGMDSEHSTIARLNEHVQLKNRQKARLYDLSISTGIVRYDPETPCTIEDLLSKADKLMYACKNLKKQRATLP